MRNRLPLLLLASFALSSGAKAMEISFSGYADARLVVPSGERSWIDGGLGKFRFGKERPSPNLRIVEAVGHASLTLADDLRVVGVGRIEPKQRTAVDFLETYLAWRPQASGDWRWSVKAGAFFPPVSVENDDLGWTSPYTLTPSAINSWVGEELRTIGGEATLERHSGWGTISAVGAIYCCNEPAGVLIADRGWALDDRPTGLFERLRVPDATLRYYHEPAPERYSLFQNVDGRIGWYGGARWDIPGLGQLAVQRYDNRADPDAETSRDESWHTRFWSGSAKTRVAGVAVLAQALGGDTAILNDAGTLRVTRFESVFLLLSYDIDDWRVSGRAEAFSTRYSYGTRMDEDGHALTAALLWNAKDWLRLSAELIDVENRRRENLLEGRPVSNSDVQFQLDARATL